MVTEALKDCVLGMHMQCRPGARALKSLLLLQITVDGDTSTNDCVLGLASGKAGGEVISDPKSSEAKELDEAVTALLQGLAKSVAWDGEGATCLIEVTAKGAQDDAAAAIIARSVAASSLVKAAVYGHDPNWGRIACAAGYAASPSGIAPQLAQSVVAGVCGSVALLDSVALKLALC